MKYYTISSPYPTFLPNIQDIVIVYNKTHADKSIVEKNACVP